MSYSYLLVCCGFIFPDFLKRYQLVCMLSIIFRFILLLALASCKQIEPSVQNTRSVNSKISRKVEQLLSTMTLEDKVGEMTQLSLDMVSVGTPYNLAEPHQLDTAKLRKVLVDLRVGSILNNGGHAQTRKHWHEIVKAIQDMAMREKKSGIPVLYGIDSIHGANYTSDATLYPQQINLAATWNPKLVKELAKISAYETRASAIPWSFSPVLDVGRDQRWSRFWETFGEDVFLASTMGVAVIEGMQGNAISSHDQVAASMKHFLGYSLPLTGKDRSPGWIPERQLREYFLPTFKAAIDAGAKTVMINSGEINGIPVHADPKILQDLLRDELGFQGLAVSDWEDIKYLYSRHRIAKDYKDAVKIAINAGIDMSMVAVDLDFPVLLKELVEEGDVPLSRIDEAVSRILTLKYELGLFETPYPDFNAHPDFGSEKFEKVALQGALESIVLLKNEDGILPLSKNGKILVTGPTAHSLNALNGSWSGTWQGTDPKYNTPNKLTLYESLGEHYGKTNVKYVEGATVDKVVNIPAAVATARNSSVAIVCIGEMPYTEKPGDINDLNLPDAQIELVEAIAKTGTPIILVLVEGRPRIVKKIEPMAKAIIFAGLAGNEGGKALSKILSGDYNPDGKLPFSYPRFANDLIPYDHKGTDQIAPNLSADAFHPQWEFGYGKSYTSYKYANLQVESLADGKYSVSVDVTNTGKRKGKETLQLYVTDKVASITPPVKRLRAFKKLEFNPGETKRYQFSLTSDDLKFVGKDNRWITEPGEFEVVIGSLKDAFTR